MRKVNYELIFSPADIARILQVEVDVVKTWSLVFAEYLSRDANPGKGIPRRFSSDDLRVFAYVMTQWEADPDIVCIKIGLNRNNHYEEIFDQLIAEATPIFMDTSMIRDGENIGMIFSPLSKLADTFSLACSFKQAGDALVEVALRDERENDLICPILYNYRHSVELFLKATKHNRKGGHDLTVLLQEFRELMKSEFKSEPPEWFDGIIHVFNEFDPEGTSFRYGASSNKYYEVYIELGHLRRAMTWMAEGFQNLADRRRSMLN